jgi:hypothetical protein
MHEQADEKLLVGYRQLAEFLTAAGFPTSKSTMSKYCAPSRDIGPPVDSYWGQLPTFRPSRALEWAHARLRPVDGRRAQKTEADRVPTAAEAESTT